MAKLDDTKSILKNDPEEEEIRDEQLARGLQEANNGQQTGGYIDASEERETMARWIRERNKPAMEHTVSQTEDGKVVESGFMQLNKDLRAGNLPKAFERKMSLGNIRAHLVLSRLAEEWGAKEAAKFFLLPAMTTLNLSASIDMAEIKQQSSSNITINKAMQEQPQQSRWNIFGRSRQPINQQGAYQ